jgi:hypothetical protein
MRVKREAGSGGDSSYKYLVSGTNREKKNLFCRKEGSIIRTIDGKRHCSLQVFPLFTSPTGWCVYH